MNFDALKEKFGPLPVWGWGVLAGGLIVVYMFVRGRFPGDAGTVVEDETVDAGDSYPTVGGVVTGNTDTAYENAVQEPTNGEWLVQAIKAVQALGVAPLAANQALLRYLQGETLSQSQADIVNKALGAVGPPPEGSPVPDVSAPPKEASPVTYDTTMSASVPKSGKAGTSVNVSISVKAKDSRAGVPTGKVRVTKDGVSREVGLASNGQANTSIKLDSAGITYVKFQYIPAGKWKGYTLPNIPIAVTK